MNEGTLRGCELDTVVGTELFKALSDPTRLGIFTDLASCCGEPRTVSELAADRGVDLSVVSRHLTALRRAGAVESTRNGREIHYRCCYGHLVEVLRRAADTIEACCPPEEAACCAPSSPEPKSSVDPKG